MQATKSSGADYNDNRVDILSSNQLWVTMAA